MKFIQKIGSIGGAEIQIEFLETGLQYFFREKSHFAKHNNKQNSFFNYSAITDNKEFVSYQHKFISNISIVFAVVVIVAYFILVSFEMSSSMNHSPVVNFLLNNSTFIFWVYLVSIIVFYRLVILRKMLRIYTTNGGHLSLFIDKNTPVILEEIKKRRISYARNLYLNEDYKPHLVLETVDWLLSIDAIDREEYVELVEFVKNNISGKGDVGFDTQDS